MRNGIMESVFSADEFAALPACNRESMGLRSFDLRDLQRHEPQIVGPSDPVISFSGFRYAYKKHAPALSLRDFDLPQNGVTAVVGLNGAGKSTFASCLCGLARNNGIVKMDGQALHWKARQKQCYMVMQDVNHQLFCESVLDEILLSQPNEDAEAAERLLERFDLLRLKSRHPLSLSGGEKQRVAIAAAVASERRIILFDEPTGGLDLCHMREVADCIRDLAAQGKTILVITHDPELVLSCCTHVLHLDEGELVDSYPLNAEGRRKMMAPFAGANATCGNAKSLPRQTEKKEGYKMKKERSRFSRLMEFAGRYKTLSIGGCILSGISAALGVLPYLCIFFVVRDVLAVWPNFGEAIQISGYGWLAMGFATGSILIYFAGLMLTHVAAFGTAKNMRSKAMRHILDLPLGYFSGQQSGKLRKIIDENAALTESLMAHHLPDAAGALVTPIAIFALLFTFDGRLGLLCLVPLVIGILCEAPMFGVKSSTYMKEYMDTLEDMNGQAVEYVRGIPVVKVFRQTVHSFKNFHAAIMRYRDFAAGYAKNNRLPMVGYTIATNGAFALLIPAGILLIRSAAEPSVFLLDFIFYIILSPLCATMMTRLMYAAQGVMKAGEAVSRIDAVFAEKPLPEPTDPQKPKDASVRFENVTFAYPGMDTPAIKDVSFDLFPGKTLALVGASGGGKTTAAALVPRFYDADAGRVLVGGVDVRNMASDDLMRQVAFVFQDTRLFKDSILENIRAARPNATREQALAAAKAAQCDDILEKLPQGVDTVIGGKGIYLSGGEQQRIALARAILKDAPIVALDEATAFADSENEAAIQKAFESLTRNKTVLMIAHRLSTVQNADEILVMADGEIKERGSHRNLLERGGVYAGMWKEYQTAVAWKVGKRVTV
jgi:ATP-binding cassette subfamily B protein